VPQLQLQLQLVLVSQAALSTGKSSSMSDSTVWFTICDCPLRHLCSYTTSRPVLLSNSTLTCSVSKQSRMDIWQEDCSSRAT